MIFWIEEVSRASESICMIELQFFLPGFPPDVQIKLKVASCLEDIELSLVLKRGRSLETWSKTYIREFAK